jgi:hypothetical protein
MTVGQLLAQDGEAGLGGLPVGSRLLKPSLGGWSRRAS